MIEFNPHPTLRSPHVQTVLSSRFARRLDATGAALLAASEAVILPAGRDEHGGEVRLRALVNAEHRGAPAVVLIHGWLGQADSPYVRRAAAALHAAGFNVARLLLRDHGETADLNVEMFNSARVEEVVTACGALIERYSTGPGGVLGFSLGGNFALRIAHHPLRSANLGACLAVCPVLDPARAVDAIDGGWFGYRWYFMRKWRGALLEKQAAFPHAYDLDEALRIPTIASLTDYLVARHLPFADTAEYYSHYTLTDGRLDAIEVPTRILAAADDPVIPAEDFARLAGAPALDVTLSRFGGHCAFIENWRLRSAIDAFAVGHFRETLLEA